MACGEPPTDSRELQSCTRVGGVFLPPSLALEVGEEDSVSVLISPGSLSCRVVLDQVKWDSDDPNVARFETTGDPRYTGPTEYSMSANAVVRAVGVGGPLKLMVVPRVRDAGDDIDDTVFLAVRVAPAAHSVTVTSPSPTVVIGTPLVLSAVVRDVNGNPLAGGRLLNWTSSNPNVAVTIAETVLGIARGSVTITATDARSGISGSITLEVR
jgi:uncharacterized protein YjdB